MMVLVKWFAKGLLPIGRVVAIALVITLVFARRDAAETPPTIEAWWANAVWDSFFAAVFAGSAELLWHELGNAWRAWREEERKRREQVDEIWERMSEEGERASPNAPLQPSWRGEKERGTAYRSVRRDGEELV